MFMGIKNFSSVCLHLPRVKSNFGISVSSEWVTSSFFFRGGGNKFLLNFVSTDLRERSGIVFFRILVSLDLESDLLTSVVGPYSLIITNTE